MLGFRANDADVLKTLSVKCMDGAFGTEGEISYDRVRDVVNEVIGVYSWDNVFVWAAYQRASLEHYVDDIYIID
ncbi:hypothetical protein PR048_023807, partial [Dryococelus australis]